MENSKRISSGILELYVAGALPEEEMREITQLVASSPEMKAEVEQLEAAFMSYASLHAPEISEKAKINIHAISQQVSVEAPSAAKIKPLKPSSNRWYLAAASILLLVSFSFNIRQYLQLRNTNEELFAMRFENEQYVQNFDNLKIKYDQTERQFSDIRQPDTQAIILNGTEAAPNAEVVAFWNPEKQNVYIDAADLPAPPAGKVYQLWWLSSLDPLTPHDAGLLDQFVENEQKLFSSGKSIGKAVAFAITLEPAGGSAQPTLEQLFVLGTV